MATCTFLHELLEARGGCRKFQWGAELPDELPDESEHVPECLTLRSTSMSLSSLRRTAFGPGCVKRSRRHKRTVTPLKGVVSATVSRCGIDWKSGCQISLVQSWRLEGLDSFSGICSSVNTLRVSKLEVSWEDLQGQFQKLWRGFHCKSFA